MSLSRSQEMNTQEAVSSKSVKVMSTSGEEFNLTLEKLNLDLKHITDGIPHVSTMEVAEKTLRGLHDGVSELEVNKLLIQTAAMKIGDEPEYSKFAARLLHINVEDEVKSLGINSFSESVNYGHKVGIFSDAALDFVNKHKDVLNAIVDDDRSKGFE